MATPRPEITDRVTNGNPLAVSVSRACELTGLGTTSVWALLKVGRLDAVRVPGPLRRSAKCSPPQREPFMTESKHPLRSADSRCSPQRRLRFKDSRMSNCQRNTQNLYRVSSSASQPRVSARARWITKPYGRCASARMLCASPTTPNASHTKTTLKHGKGPAMRQLGQKRSRAIACR
jgi:hypothetical protein